MEHGRAILFLIAALLLAGCQPSPNPAADARRALAAGDRRLVGYMGVGLIVPGTPAEFQRGSYAPGVRVVSDVTDTSPRHQIEKAADYATRYNQVILGSDGRAP